MKKLIVPLGVRRRQPMPWTNLVADQKSSCSGLEGCTESKRRITYGQAVAEAMTQAMAMDQSVITLGQGVDEAGYVYNTTAGLSERFGKERVVETPIAEAAMTGLTLGAAITGLRPILIHMRNDFLLVSMDQIVNHIAHWQTLFPSERGVPLVIRGIVARGWGSGAQHSQSFHALFAGLSGLKVVMPTTPYDVKGMLLGAVASTEPVLFLEHRWLYGDEGYVPEEPYILPFDKAILRQEGKDLTIVAVSLANRFVKMAMEEETQETGITADWIDLCSINPLDLEPICQSVCKTGRLLIVEDGPITCGIGAEISAQVTERCWGSLKKPVLRVGWSGSSVPAGTKMEEHFYPGIDEIRHSIASLLK